MLPAALIDTRSTAAEAIAEATRAHYGNDNSPVKRLARVVRREERTAENYWQGKSCPGVPEFLRLAMEVPELRAAVAQLLKLDITHDPRAHRLMQQITGMLAEHPPGSMD